MYDGAPKWMLQAARSVWYLFHSCSLSVHCVYLRRHDGGKETDEIIVLIKSAMSLRLRPGTSHVWLPYKWVIFSRTLETAGRGKQNVTVLTTQWRRNALLMCFKLLLSRSIDFFFNQKGKTFRSAGLKLTQDDYKECTQNSEQNHLRQVRKL